VFTVALTVADVDGISVAAPVRTDGAPGGGGVNVGSSARTFAVGGGRDDPVVIGGAGAQGG